MKYIIFAMLLGLVSCQEKEAYTVMFINQSKDTTYLLNSKPLTLSEAKEIAEGYPYSARPILFDSVYTRNKD